MRSIPNVDGIHWNDRHPLDHAIPQHHQRVQLEGHRSTRKVLRTSASLKCPSLSPIYKINMLENKTRGLAKSQPALHSNLVARLQRRPSPRDESRLMSSTPNKRLLQHCPSQSRIIEAAAGMLRPELNARLRPPCSSRCLYTTFFLGSRTTPTPTTCSIPFEWADSRIFDSVVAGTL